MVETAGQLSAAQGQIAIAYRQQSGNSPTLVFLHGFRSDMKGSKAAWLSKFCAEKGQAFLRFDLPGHGQSSGTYTDFTIGDWVKACLHAIDSLTTGPLILVGSSLGGWMMLHVAALRPERVKALIGIAAAPDFVTEVIDPTISDAQKHELATTGKFTSPSIWPEPNVFTARFLEEARQQCIIDKPHPFTGPVRLMHGLKDADIPWQHALKIANCLQSADVQITLIKDGNHQLSETAQLEELGRLVTCLSGAV